jgi:hypothetical protein
MRIGRDGKAAASAFCAITGAGNSAAAKAAASAARRAGSGRITIVSSLAKSADDTPAALRSLRSIVGVRDVLRYHHGLHND